MSKILIVDDEPLALDVLDREAQRVLEALKSTEPGIVARTLEGIEIELVEEITDEDREKERLAFERLKTPEGSSER